MPWLKLLPWAAAFAVGAFAGAWPVKTYYQNELTSVQLAQAEAAAQFQRDKEAALLQQLEQNNEISRLHAALQRKQEVKHITNTVEVIKYVESDDAGKCDLPPEFVRIHNAAASGGNVSTETDTASGVDAGGAGALVGKTDKDFAPVLSRNYNRCHQVHAKLKALRAWARGD
jgi:hypothetical protein